MLQKLVEDSLAALLLFPRRTMDPLESGGKSAFPNTQPASGELRQL